MSVSNALATSTVSPTSAPTIELRALLPGDDATAFRTLNEEWIARYFSLNFPCDGLCNIGLQGQYIAQTALVTFRP